MMNTDELTIGQLKQIAAMVGMPTATVSPHPFVGRYVICRCTYAGVHAGVLVSQEGDQAVLRNSRRLWSWRVKGDGIALSGVANTGVAKESKLDAKLPEIALTGVIETIPCSVAAQESINGH